MTSNNAAGETSGSASNATDLNSKDDYMVIDVIYEKLQKLPRDEPNGDTDEFKVHVCHVPKSLSSEKPEAFIPQCVGLGPYHHFRDELIMTEELKLGVVKRVPKVRDLLPDNRDALSQRPQNFVFDNNTIQAFYHADVRTTCDHCTLLYMLTVDGLFLLAFLCRDADSDDSYFLTGKQGMPLVNAAGVEVTVNAIVRDVFMLENQIPIHVLKKISGVNVNSRQIQQEHILGETILNFCRPLCPLVQYSEQVSAREAEEESVHLLDLVYHLTAPQAQHVPESEQKKLKPQLNCRNIFLYIILGPCCLLMIIAWVLLYWFMYMQQLIIRWVVRPLFSKAIPWVVSPILGTNPLKMPVIPYFLGPIIGLRDSANSSEEVVTIPSATKLDQIGIKLKPAEGGISSFRFEIFKVYLPPIRLDEISEVIIRNLVAYESLTKSNDDLIFTRYIDVMSALTVTSEDVKLLVRDKIIQTQLSDEVVAQLFNGMMSKSIRPTKMANLEEAIKKVNAFVRYIQTMAWFTLEYIRLIFIYNFVVLFYPLMRDVVMGVFCFTSYRHTAVCNSRGVGDYGRNISFISSM